MYFKIVKEHSNMSHTGDLIRSDLYYTNANKEILNDILNLVAKLNLCVADSILKVSKMLEIFDFEVKKVECDIVFNLSE